jgi:hypothetical protein
MDMVTVARYTNLLEAHIARGRLESEGITAFIADENIIWANWLLVDAIGGVQLQVPREDCMRARQILSDVADIHASENGLARVETRSDHCPRCRTHPVQDSALLSRLAYLSLVWIGSPSAFNRELKYCRECGYSHPDRGEVPYFPLILLAGMFINFLLLIGVLFLLYGIAKGIEHYL